ncbi:MAG: lysine--tRNA ligase [Phycisphaerales bacterium]|nr:lysine--tRNA ligase [Phycisphaerales bacterium]
MSESPSATSTQGEAQLIANRRAKLERWRDELGLQPWGTRVDDLISLAQARASFDQAASDAMEADPPPETDPRPRVRVAGRVMQHRAMGKLCFMSLRDHSGDLQISCSKAQMEAAQFKLASKIDYGDIVVAEGPMGVTKRGEICVWADAFQVHGKSLAPPPEKFHGLADPEMRARRRHVDMYANPDTMRVFTTRSRLVGAIRTFMQGREFLEVETPMMHPVAGGAAARPFVTHHNTLDMELFMRIAPELYLKRLLVGGMPRVFEINRNFRNEGISRRHNPEFTMMEAYQAFGDRESVLELTETLLRHLAVDIVQSPTTTWGDHEVDWTATFDRVSYADLFQRGLGCDMRDEAAVRAAAASRGVDGADNRDHWLLVDALFGDYAESALDPCRPTFVVDFPSSVSPLARPREDDATLAWRSELFVCGMELGNFYTELNDPDIQRRYFTDQLDGIDEETAAFRSMDEDFLDALMVGMPPAGGMGIGIDRIVMLMTGATSIRDVILFPLLRPEGEG